MYFLYVGLILRVNETSPNGVLKDGFIPCDVCWKTDSYLVMCWEMVLWLVLCVGRWFCSLCYVLRDGFMTCLVCISYMSACSCRAFRRCFMTGRPCCWVVSFRLNRFRLNGASSDCDICTNSPRGAMLHVCCRAFSWVFWSEWSECKMCLHGCTVMRIVRFPICWCGCVLSNLRCIKAT